MNIGLVVSIIDILVAIMEIITTYLFSLSIENRKELRSVVKVPLTKLIAEILLMEDSSYPGMTIRDNGFNALS